MSILQEIHSIFCTDSHGTWTTVIGLALVLKILQGGQYASETTWFRGIQNLNTCVRKMFTISSCSHLEMFNMGPFSFVNFFQDLFWLLLKSKALLKLIHSKRK